MSVDRDTFRNYGIYFVEMERRMYWNESYHCNERVYFAVVPVRGTGKFCGHIPAGELVFEGTREVGIDAPLYISGRDRVPFMEAYPHEKLGGWVRKNLGKDLPNVPGFLSLSKADKAKYLKMAGCPVSLATKLQPPQVLEGIQAVFIGSFSQDDKIDIMTLVKSHGGDCHIEVRPKFKYTHVVEGTTVTTQWGGTQGRGSKKWKQAVKSGARVVSPAWIKSTVAQLVANAKAAKEAQAATKASSNKAKATTKKSKKRASKSQPVPAAATTCATAATTTVSTTSTVASAPASTAVVAGGGAGGGAGASPGGGGGAATVVAGDASGPTTWLDEHSEWADKEEAARKVRAAERKAKIAANKAKREAEKAARAARAGPPTRRSSRVRRSRDMFEAEHDTSAAAAAAGAAGAAGASAASDSATTSASTSSRPTKRKRRTRR